MKKKTNLKLLFLTYDGEKIRKKCVKNVKITANKAIHRSSNLGRFDFIFCQFIIRFFYFFEIYR